MKTPVKLSAYGLSLAVVFTGGWAVGNAVGPFGASTPTIDGHHSLQASDRGVAATTPTVPASPPTDPAPPEQQPQTPGAPDASVMPPTPTVAASSAPAATEVVTAPRPQAQRQGQRSVQPELVAAGEPIWERSQPHDRRGEASRHEAGKGKGAHDRRHRHQQELRGEGHR